MFQSIFTFSKNKEGPSLFLCKCNCASAVWVESPDEISSKFWRSLFCPPDTRSLKVVCLKQICIYNYISLSLSPFLPSYLSISTPIYMYRYPLKQKQTASLSSAASSSEKQSLIHGAGVLIPSVIYQGLCRNITVSLSSFSIAPFASLSYMISSPLRTCLAPYRLSVWGHDYWLCQWSSSGMHVPYEHGWRVENRVKRAWAQGTD